MRKRIYEIIEPAEQNDKLSAAYDFLMMATIIASIIPLAFKTTNVAFQILEYICTGIFIFDYLLRLVTADFKLKKNFVV